MENWFNKTDEEIIQRLKNVLRTEDFQFIGKYEQVQEKDFGFFKNVRSLSGVRNYYPTNEGEPDENKLRSVQIYTNAYSFLKEGEWYKFKSTIAPPLHILTKLTTLFRALLINCCIINHLQVVNMPE